MVGVRSALGAALVLALCTHAHAFLVPTPAASLLPSAALSLRRPDAGHAGGMKMCSGGIARQESSFRSPPIDRRGVVGSVMLPVGLGALLQVRAGLGGWVLVGLELEREVCSGQGSLLWPWSVLMPLGGHAL